MISHHPDDVITIYSCSSSDPDLNDIYCQPSAEELPTTNLQHDNHKIQMNNVINHNKNAANYIRWLGMHRAVYHSRPHLVVHDSTLEMMSRN